MFSLVLAAVKITDFLEGVFNQISEIRLQSIDSLNIIPIATGIAALFLVFKFIGLVRDIEEDNEGSGFGHIKLWDAILRPLLFFALTINCGTIIKGVDGAMGGITNSISSMTGKGDEDFMTKLSEANKDFEAAADKALKEIKEKTNSSNTGWLKKVFNNALSILLEWNFKAVSFVVKWIILIISYGFQILYQLIMLSIVGISQFNLIILGAMMPFAFALSILDGYKDNYKKVIGYYVEYLLWRPLILMIVWMSTVFYHAVNSHVSDAIAEIFKDDAMNSAVFTLMLTPSATIVACLLCGALCLAGLSQVPSLSNKVLSLGSPAEKESYGLFEKSMRKFGM